MSFPPVFLLFWHSEKEIDTGKNEICGNHSFQPAGEKQATNLQGCFLKLGYCIKWVRSLSESQEPDLQPTNNTQIHTSVPLSVSHCVSLCQTVTTAATPGAAVVAVWASRVTTAACWGAGTQPTALPRAPPIAGSTLTTDWWAELSSDRKCKPQGPCRWCTLSRNSPRP